MSRVLIYLFLTTFCVSSTLQAEEGFCRKCQILREHHKNHPSKYTYYEDYMKDLEEKGEDAVNLNPEDLPPEVQYIMKGKKDGAE